MAGTEALFYPTYVDNPFVKENCFLGAAPLSRPWPGFKESKGLLPRPFWQGYDSTIECYWKVWEIAFRNFRKATPQNGFVSDFNATAFNDCTFMWDSAFICMFGRYAKRAWDFQHTLDNFYAKQHPDGFICREIREADGTDCFSRFDPTGTGPNILPWAEWEYFRSFGDQERLARVFPPLVAYTQWFRHYRSWPLGGYWATGLASGMDNQPRVAQGDSRLNSHSHGHLAWVDACMQHLLAIKILVKMAVILGRRAEIGDLEEEGIFLEKWVNEQLWDPRCSFYYDLRQDGSTTGVKSVGAYWSLLAEAVPRKRLAPFLAHLDNPAEFKRAHRVPSLAADNPDFKPDGGYWLGAVWAPTNYMLLKGLSLAQEDSLAHEIGKNHLENVVAAFEKTGTLWENYAPDRVGQGMCRKDFVGWSGLPPTAVLFEYVFGLRPEVPHNKLVWDIRLLDEHGVENYPFGNQGLLHLLCRARASAFQEPKVEVESNLPIQVEVRWHGGSKTIGRS